MAADLLADIEKEVHNVFHENEQHDQCNKKRSGLFLAASYSDQGETNAFTFNLTVDEKGSPLAPLTISEQGTNDKLLELKTFLKVVGNYNPNRVDTCKYPCCRQVVCYFSGEGGYDRDGNIYMFTDPGKKIFISEIADILCKGATHIRREKFTCILLFELYSQTKPDNEPRLPNVSEYGNIVIAFSGFQKASVEEEGEVSKWTQKLIDDFKSCMSGNSSLIDCFEATKKEFPHSLYVSSCGHVLLNNADVCQSYNDFSSSLTKATNQGIIVVAKSPENMFAVDVESVATTFNDLNFKVLYSENSSELIKLVKLINIPKYNDHFHFLSFYYSGYGGREDDGRIYLEINHEKIYIDWIISIFKQRRENKPCFILLDLCLPDGSPSLNQEELPFHTTNNCILALSGLHGAKISRTSQKEGKWTQRLCHNISQLDQPFIDILDLTGSQLSELGTQYVNTAVLFYLKKPTRIFDQIEGAEELLMAPSKHQKGATNITPPKNISAKQPRPGDIITLLSDIATEWKLIGQYLSVPERILSNITAANAVQARPPTTNLISVTNKANNLTWADLCTAVGSVSARTGKFPGKQEEIERRLREDPSIYTNYADDK